MDVKRTNNQVFSAANKRLSVYDVYSPRKDGCFPVVLFAHGFKGFKDWGHWPFIFERLAADGIHVIAFNFSHNGGTIENPIDFPDLKAFSENTYSKELEDLSSITDLLFEGGVIGLDQFDLNTVSLIGHSRGGGSVLLHAAKDNRISKVITWAAVSDFKARLPKADDLKKWEREGVRYITNSRTKQEMPMKYSLVLDLLQNESALHIEPAVRSLKIPQLIIHGDSDEAVDLQNAQDLAGWNATARIKIITGANHVFGGKHPMTERLLSKEADELIETTSQFLLN